MSLSFSLHEFLKTRNEFLLGKLTTEAFHPLTKKLSEVIDNDLSKALLILKEVDELALKQLSLYTEQIYTFQKVCQKILKTEGRIFLCGCGATGRLALSLEKISQEMNLKNRVISFMAGGDFALVKSVESFEDRKEYGARQLKDLGFGRDDLLIGITEGGETSFVIGAVEYARDHSDISPYFLYCNPDSELEKIKRSQKIINDENIIKLNLTVGPMALSGSTRMQATTVQMIACGVALFFNHKSFSLFEIFFQDYIASFLELDIAKLESFIREEFKLYQSGGIVTYKAQERIAIAVLTDTTERSPTFSLDCFEQYPQDPLALSYLAVSGTNESDKAWESMLGRTPRALDWDELSCAISIDDLHAFDISEKSYKRREKNKRHKVFHIEEKKSSLIFQIEPYCYEFSLKKEDLLFKHLSLKLLLNTHSTLLMGLMKRFEMNMMTYVKASNFKLVDRAMRYVTELLKSEGIIVDEIEMAELIYKYKDRNKPIVLELRDHFLRKKE